MKKNLLTFLFVVAFLCGGALAVSAKNTLLPANSVAVSKSAKKVSKEIKSLKANCKFDDCGYELQFLLDVNDFYNQQCAPNYYSSCEPDLANALIRAGNDYEACLDSPYQSKKVDRNMDRKKIEQHQAVLSK